MCSTYVLAPGLAFAGNGNGQGAGSSSTASNGNGGGNQKPIASIASGVVTYVGLPTVIDGSASSPGSSGSRIVAYDWSYDGAAGHWSGTTTTPKTTVTFGAPAWQEFKLRVTDAAGNSSQDLTHVRILQDDTAPVALIAAPSSALIRTAVTLDGSGSYDPHGAIASYTWDFGDGSPVVTSSDMTALSKTQHTWNTAGTYTLKLTVKDFVGMTGSTTKQLVVTGGVPAQPIGLTAADHPSDQGRALDIKWTANTDSGLTGYKLYRALSSAGPFTTAVASLGLVTSYADTNLTDGTIYYYAVTALGAGGESLRSAVASATPTDNLAPSTPKGLAAADVPNDAGDAISVSWIANTESDVAGYKVGCYDGATAIQTIDVKAAATTCKFASLAAGHTYTFRISAYDAEGNASAQSSAVTCSPVDQLAPAVPTGVAAANETADASIVDLSWNANTEADLNGYSVYRRNGATGPDTLIATVQAPATTFVDSTCIAGQQYGYSVKAFDKWQNVSGASQVALVHAIDNVRPLAVPSVGASNVSPDQGGTIRAWWSPSTSLDTASYIAECLDPSGVVVGRWTGSALECTFGGLQAGTKYSVVVYAKDASLNVSDPSEPAFATPTDDIAPAAPAAPVAADVVPDNGGSIFVSWPANTEPDLGGYTLACIATDGSVQTLDVGFATRHQFDGLQVGATYSFEVRARDIHGNVSASSARVSQAGKDEVAPAAVTVAASDRPADQGSVIDITWGASASADTVGYKVYRDGAWVSDVTGTSFADQIFDPAEHAYTVKAFDAAGNLSDESNASKATAVDNLAPAIPAGVTAVDVSADQGGVVSVTFAGSPDSDIDGYELQAFGPDGSLAGKLQAAALDRSAVFADLTNGVEYTFKVLAYDTSGNRSALSDGAKATPADNLAPATPTGAAVSDVAGDEGGALALTWTANIEPDLAGYRVYRATSEMGPWGQPIATTTTNSFTDESATLGTVWCYAIVAVDGSGNASQLSAPAYGASADNVAPAKPSGLAVADVAGDDGGALHLTWTASAEKDLASYSVYRAASADGPWGASVATGLSTPAWTDAHAALGQTFFYRVTASDASNNESVRSDAAGGASTDELAPAAPTGATVTEVMPDNGGALRIEWNANAETDLDHYTLYRAQGTGDFTPVGTGLSATNFLDANATLGRDYRYAVSATDASNNESAKSAVVSGASHDEVAPESPTGFAAADVPSDTGTAVALNWSRSASSDAVGYRVRYYALTFGSPSPTPVVKDVGDATSCRIDELTVGQTYLVEVAAYDAAGNESAPTATLPITPLDNIAPAVPAGLAVADRANDQGDALVVSWTANTDSDFASYTLERATSAAGPWTAVAGGLTATSHTDAGLTPGAKRFYRVSANDVWGNTSAFCDAADGTTSDDIAPGVPAGLKVDEFAPDQGGALSASWLPNADADLATYTLYRATDGGSFAKFAEGLASPSFFDATAQLAHTYAYVVTATDASGNESDKSAAVSGTSHDEIAPAKPAGLSAIDTPADEGGSVSLAWTANAENDLAGYTVYRIDGSTATKLADVDGTSFVVDSLNDGTSYTFAVTARDASTNESPRSDAAEATPRDYLPPAVPAAPKATIDPAGGALSLSWPAVTGAASYNLYRDGVLLAGGLTSPSFADTGLTNNHAYSYTVTSVDAANPANESAASPATVATPKDTTPPAVPDAPKATVDPVGGSVGLDWPAVSGAASYNVYRDGALVASGLPVPGFTDISLTNDQAYSYTVTSVDAADPANESAGSPTTIVTPKDTTPPAVPAAPKATIDPVGGALTLDWPAVNGAAAYNVYRDRVLLAANVTASNFTDIGLTNNQAYSYTVTSLDAASSANESAQSPSTSATPKDTTAPAVPDAPHATIDPVGGAVSLSWPAVSGAAAYNLYRDGVLLAGGLTSPSFADTGLTNNQAYSYTVTSVDAATPANESAASPAISASPRDTTAPAVPAAPAVTVDSTGGSVALSWPAVSGAETYKLYRDGALLADGLTVPSFVDAGLTDNQSYSYTVTSVDAATPANESAASPATNATPKDTTAPAIPGAPAATIDPAGGAVSLDWPAVGGAATYNLYRDGVLVKAGLTSPSFADTGLTNNIAYSYTVSAVDAATPANESAVSPATSATPKDTTAPAVPAAPAATVDPAGSAISLSWPAVSGADTYKLYRDGVLLAGGLTAPSFNDTGLTNNQPYSYTVTSVDAATPANESAASPATSATPKDTTAPAVPAAPAATIDPAGSAVSLSWPAVSGAASYNLYRDGILLAGALTASSFNDTGLTNNHAYSYTVTSVDAATPANESAASPATSATPKDTTPPAVPVGLTAADTPNDQGGSLAIAWSASTSGDVAGYKLYRDGELLVDQAGISFTDATAGASEHSYAVSAYDAAGNESALSGSSSAAALDNVAPSAPAGLAVTDVPMDQGGALAVSWIANTDDAVSYTIRAYLAGLLVGQKTVAANSTTFDGLQNGPAYSVTVSACDAAANNSVECLAVSATPEDNLLPATPVNVAAVDITNAGDATIRVEWPANTESDLAGYTLYRSLVSGGPYTKLTDVTNSPYTDNGVVLGTKYFYVLTARDATHESVNSAEAYATPIDAVPPTAPGNLVGVDTPNDGGGFVDLSWNGAGDAVKYTVYRSATKGGPYAKVGQIAAPAFTDNVGACGVKFYYVITASDASNNESLQSNEAEVSSRDNLPPAAPAGLSVLDREDDTGGVLNLNWTASPESDVTHYKVSRANSAVGPFTEIADVTGTSLQDTGLQNGTSYYYAVTAWDRCGNSSPACAAVSAAPVVNVDHIAPGDVGAVTLTPGNAMIALNWAPVQDNVAVTGYEVYRKQGVNGSYAEVANAMSEAFTNSSLSNGVTYYYKIRAYDAAGNFGGFSADVSGAPSLARVMSTTTIEDNSSSISYLPANAWIPWSESGYSAGHMMHTRTAGATATITFSGTAVSVNCYDVGYVNRGLAAIYIDGVFQRNVDLSTPAAAWGNVFYQSGPLADGSHTLQVVCLGRAGAYTTADCIVDIDWLTVTKNGPAPPAAPKSLAVVDRPADDGDGLNLTWAANTEPDLTAYRVWRSATATGTYAPVADLGKVTTYVDTGLTRKTGYYYQLTAIDAYGAESPRSAVVSCITVDQKAPATPTGLAAVDKPNDDAGRVLLSWTANAEPDAVGYRIYRSTSAAGPFTIKVGDVTTNKFEDSGLTNNTTYYYEITCYDSSGNESAKQTTPVSVVPKDDVKPDSPILTITDRPGDGGDGLLLSWTLPAAADLAGYKVYRGTSSVGPWTLVSTVTQKTTRTFTDTGLAMNNTYYYRVTAYDTSGNESIDAIAVAGTPKENIAPSAPTYTLALAGDGYAGVSWVAATDNVAVTGYEVWMKIGSAGAYAKVADVPGILVGTSIYGLANGTQYYFKVRAYDAAGNVGVYSTERATVPMAAVNGGVVNKIEDNDADVIYAPAAAWIPWSESGYTGGHMMHTRTAGATASFTFAGTGVSIAGDNVGYVNRGLAEIWIDGVFQRQVDLSAPAAAWGNVFYQSGQLADGPHTIMVKCLGKPGVYTTNDCIVDIDCLNVTLR